MGFIHKKRVSSWVGKLSNFGRRMSSEADSENRRLYGAGVHNCCMVFKGNIPYPEDEGMQRGVFFRWGFLDAETLIRSSIGPGQMLQENFTDLLWEAHFSVATDQILRDATSPEICRKFRNTGWDEQFRSWSMDWMEANLHNQNPDVTYIAGAQIALGVAMSTGSLSRELLQDFRSVSPSCVEGYANAMGLFEQVTKLEKRLRPEPGEILSLKGNIESLLEKQFSSQIQGGFPWEW